MGQETIRTLISAIGGAVITGVFGVWLQRLKNQGSNENIYADHTNDLFKRLDRITSERDDLKEQVIELKAQVQNLNVVIDSLNEQMASLTAQLNKFTKKEEEN